MPHHKSTTNQQFLRQHQETPKITQWAAKRQRGGRAWRKNSAFSFLPLPLIRFFFSPFFISLRPALPERLEQAHETTPSDKRCDKIMWSPGMSMPKSMRLVPYIHVLIQRSGSRDGLKKSEQEKTARRGRAKERRTLLSTSSSAFAFFSLFFISRHPLLSERLEQAFKWANRVTILQREPSACSK